MTPKQLAILNSLVTYAAENVPGGLSPEEQEVARIVGAAALLGAIEIPEPEPEPKSEQPTQIVRHRFEVVFVGHTEDNHKIVIYKNLRNDEQLYLRYDDGGIWALSPGSEIQISHSIDEKVRLRIRSPEWSGEAIGTDEDLLEELKQ